MSASVLVWVLVIMTSSGPTMDSGVSTVIIDNIATAESCEQLARVVRASPRPAQGGVAATCAPVRKAVAR